MDSVNLCTRKGRNRSTECQHCPPAEALRTRLGRVAGNHLSTIHTASCLRSDTNVPHEGVPFHVGPNKRFPIDHDILEQNVLDRVRYVETI